MELKYKICSVLFFAFVFVLFSFAEENDFGLEFKFGGTIETVHGATWEQELKYSASRSFAVLNGDIFVGDAYAHIALQAEYNYVNPKRNGFRLNEAYFKYSGEIWDISVGRQIITWGQADGFSLTDVLTAKDMTEFIATNSTVTQLASDSIRLRFFHDVFTFEAIAIPFFTPNKLPRFNFEDVAGDDLFTINLPSSVNLMGSNIKLNYKKNEANNTRRFLDTELAAKFSFYLSALDFSISGFYGRDKTPEFVKRFKIPNTIILDTRYNKIGMAGFDAAIPAGPVLIRLEAAWIANRRFEPTEEKIIQSFTSTGQSSNYKKNQLLMLAGIDWNYGTLFLSGQYFEDLVVDHKDDIARPVHKGFVSLNVSKKFLRETLKLSAVGVIDINYGSTFSTYSLDYALTDNLHCAFGGDVYTKGYDKKGDFAEMSKLTSLWLRATFSW